MPLKRRICKYLYFCSFSSLSQEYCNNANTTSSMGSHTEKSQNTEPITSAYSYTLSFIMCLVQSCVFSVTPPGILMRTVTTMVHLKSPFIDFCILLITSESYFTKFAQFFVFYFPTELFPPQKSECQRIKIQFLLQTRETLLFFLLLHIGNSSQDQTAKNVS